VPHRVFTVDEANEALATVRPLAEAMVEHRRTMLEALARQEKLEGAVKGNGGGLDAETPRLIEAEIEEAGAELARCVEAIQELGAVVKDLDSGLVDFPARRHGEDVLLCWRVGEEEIRYWHGLDDGFAGRREL
jgi:hypothetical protein